MEGKRERFVKDFINDSLSNGNYAPIVLLVGTFLGFDRLSELAGTVGGRHEADEAFKAKDEGALRSEQKRTGEDGEESSGGGDTALQDERQAEQMGDVPLGE